MTKKLKDTARQPIKREPRPEKVKAVEKLRETLSSSTAFYLADFRGIDVSGFTKLRRTLRSADSGIRVVKNNLLKRALADMKMEELATKIDGQNAVIYAMGDEVAPVRIFNELTSEKGVGALKAGVLAGRVIGGQDLDTLSRLPSSQELRAKVAGIFYAQLAGPVYVLKGLLTKLVYALNAIRENRASEEA
ncbi:MAG: 50S ribosomal protein L10 [candidate division WOR-3 bacterium]